MIEDPEFRHLFQVECDEHLQALDAGLLTLEKSPEDTPTLQEVFRAAHSLKGAARMMNLLELERVAHELESLLGKSKQGECLLTADMIDLLCSGVDAMRALCHEAVTGEAVQIDVDCVVRSFHGEKENEPAKAEGPERDGISNPEKLDESAVPGEGEQLPDSPAEPAPSGGELAPPVEVQTPAPQRIESIRVNTDKLDRLVAQSSELVVVRNRYSHRLSELEGVTAGWSECKKSLESLRIEFGRCGGSVADNESLLALFEHYTDQFRALGTMLKQSEAGAREDNARLGMVTESLEDEIRSLRMLPFQNVFARFPRLVRDIAREQGKEVNLIIEGEKTCADKAILEEIKDPLSHMVRNAIDHGIESPPDRAQGGKPQEATLTLRAYQTSSSVLVEIEDDGRGLDAEKIKSKAVKKNLISSDEAALMSDQQVYGLIFTPGFSTADMVTDLSGRGVGMDVVRANVEKLKGSIEIESRPGKGSLFRLSFPLTLATTRALIFRSGTSRYALPIDIVERAIFLSEESLLSLGGVEAISLQSEVVPVYRLTDLIPFNGEISERGLSKKTQEELACVIIAQRGEKVGLIVDELESEQEIVLKAHGHILERVRNIACSTILETGEVCLVLNGSDLLRTVSRRAVSLSRAIENEDEEHPKRILLAEDSLTTRTQEKRILEAAGYEVVAAVDGAEALEKLGSAEFDLVVSDVEMPRLDGLSLTRKIRDQSRYAELPIILVTSLASDEDKRRGSEAGANAYITKGSFDHQLLLDTIRRLI